MMNLSCFTEEEIEIRFHTDSRKVWTKSCSQLILLGLLDMLGIRISVCTLCCVEVWEK